MRNITIESNNGSFNYSIISSIEGVIGKIEGIANSNSCFYIVDSNVHKIYHDQFKHLFTDKNCFVLNATEEYKSFESIYKIYDFLLENNADRSSYIIVIGGGITGDTGSFAASTFMRGTRLIHVPTTLLAMVDSSIGGKTGVNYKKYKNFIGSFYEPEQVITSSKFLSTLKQEDVLSGMGEVLKYALIDSNFFDYCYSRLDGSLDLPEDDLLYLIGKSAQIKNDVVTQDKKDLKMRHSLNLGHTFGHAIESVSGFSVKHGIGVIAGLRGATFLAHKMGVMDNKVMEKVLDLLGRYKVDEKINTYSTESVYLAMQGDKKRVNGEVKFVLISQPGSLHIDVTCEKQDVLEAIDYMKSTIG
ncbi:MAG: 3-dehydroquinate synthase [Ignavibacteriales bacterium]|nr:3-dehydroquinate synthase [Ignavibacteriales bacterium]